MDSNPDNELHASAYCPARLAKPVVGAWVADPPVTFPLSFSLAPSGASPTGRFPRLSCVGGASVTRSLSLTSKPRRSRRVQHNRSRLARITPKTGSQPNQ